MAGYQNGNPGLCWLGRTAQKLGCLPNKFATSAQIYYPIEIHPVDSDPVDRGPVDRGPVYSDDIKYKPGRYLPSPQPDEPKLQTMPYVAAYQNKSPRVPKSPKKTPVAQTCPLSTLPLQFNSLPVNTPTATCVTLNVDLPPDDTMVQINRTPYHAPLSAIPHTYQQSTIPDSILQDLGNIAPTQYIWNTPHGALAYTPAPASHLTLPNPLADFSPHPLSPLIADPSSGNDGSAGLAVIPSPIPSDTSDSSSDCSNSGHRFGLTLHPLFTSNCPSSEETPIEWNVSDPADMARHVECDGYFLQHAHEPATDPPTNQLCIDLCFLGQPGVRWNWEPITIRKGRPIRIADILHAIHNYFHIQLTRDEYRMIKSHGKDNVRIVANSWRERVHSQLDGEARSRVHYGGLRRVDCLGTSKVFAGLWVERSRLKLGLRG